MATMGFPTTARVKINSRNYRLQKTISFDALLMSTSDCMFATTQMVVTHERFHFGFLLKADRAVNRALTVSAKDLALTALTECGVFVIFGMAITEDSELSTGVGIRMFGCQRACGTNGCTSLIFTPAVMFRFM